MSRGKFLFTSESVSMGHPDKLAEQISDGILDALLAADPMSRVACETLVTTDFCCLAGEITTKAKVDYEKVARQVIREVGYTDEKIGFSSETCKVNVLLHSQSPDIAMAVYTMHSVSQSPISKINTDISTSIHSFLPDLNLPFSVCFGLNPFVA